MTEAKVTDTPTPPHPTHRGAALAMGAAFLVFGVAGLVVARETPVLDQVGVLLFWLFGVNTLQSSVHVLLGAALLLAGLAKARAAKVVVTTVGMFCLALGFLGLALVSTEFNLLALNGADNVLHFASASLLLAIGLGAGRRSDDRH